VESEGTQKSAKKRKRKIEIGIICARKTGDLTMVIRNWSHWALKQVLKLFCLVKFCFQEVCVFKLTKYIEPERLGIQHGPMATAHMHRATYSAPAPVEKLHR
jgi:hypothetical protein